MLWIISGPSSVGKSTFITSPRCIEITGLPPDTPTVWPATQSRLNEHGTGDFLYHYNILRPLELKSRRWYGRAALLKKQPAPQSAISFGQDPKWKELTGHGLTKKAIVLVASRQALLERVRKRQAIEVSKLPGQKSNRYSARRWLNYYEQVDLIALYQAWCRQLQYQNIPYTLVNSNDETYSIIDSEDRLPDLINSDSPSNGDSLDETENYGTASSYTKEQIEKILQEREFEYHQVSLPYGLHTPGDNRSPTRDLIFPKSLVGRSVLDVGCALGYFCFEAESKGASKIVGVELKEDRFNDALLLKDIKGSKVDFRQRDIISNPLNERFDYILLLNVIHHLNEPFRAIRQLASITNERLIIEFPTFADRKFRRASNTKLPFLYNRLPLVGVSSITRADQTFVFTPSAIKRTLLDHERLFEKVDIFHSPMPGRAIAICYK